MIPKDKVEAIIVKHEKIEKELSSSQIDPKEYAAKSKEYSELNNVISIAKNYLNYENEKKLENLVKESSGDDEMLNLAKRELINLNKQFVNNENSLKVFYFQKIKTIKKMRL